jgi:hypothetical protein
MGRLSSADKGIMQKIFEMALKLILISFKVCTLIVKYKKRIDITGLPGCRAPHKYEQTIDYYKVFCVLLGK